MAAPAPFGKCPICKNPVSIEMLPMGFKQEGQGKKKKMKISAVFDAALAQTIRYIGEMLARSIASAVSAGTASPVAGKRQLYYTCNYSGSEDGAPACPLCYSKSKSYLERTPLGTFTLVGDATGISIEMLRSVYTAQKKAYEMQQALKKKKKGGG